MPSGDEARISVLVKVPRDETFRIFTEEIDRWWRRGFQYRVSGTAGGVLALEGKVGGRLFETYERDGETVVAESGRVTVWEPPTRLAFEWRAMNFAPDEKTEVEVDFAPSPSGTLVTVVHRGWSQVRPDHPARHGLEVAPFLRMMGMWWGDLLGSLRVYATRSPAAHEPKQV